MNTIIENEIFEASPSPIIIIDGTSGRLINANSASEILLSILKTKVGEYLNDHWKGILLAPHLKKSKDIEINTGRVAYCLKPVKHKDFMILFAQDMTSSSAIAKKNA